MDRNPVERTFRRAQARMRIQIALRKLRKARPDRPLILGFWIPTKKMLSAAAVEPDAAFIRFGSTSWARWLSHQEVQSVLEKVAEVSTMLRPTVIVWGIADKTSGHDVSELFPSVLRVERGLLPGPPHWRLMTCFMIDAEGIYFDGRRSSDCEAGLQALRPGYASRSRTARALLDHVRHSQITKYELNGDSAVCLGPDSLLILGQVNGDQAIENAVAIETSNADFISWLHSMAPPIAGVSKVYYKPHPMNRRDNEAEIAGVQAKYPDLEVIDPRVNVHKLFAQKPRVATMTSGAGLEAALHGCEVHTFGIPFYAGWGFTVDHFQCPRRTNRLSAEDVAAFMWINRTVYVNPKTRAPVAVEAAFGLPI